MTQSWSLEISVRTFWFWFIPLRNGRYERMRTRSLLNRCSQTRYLQLFHVEVSDRIGKGKLCWILLATAIKPSSLCMCVVMCWKIWENAYGQAINSVSWWQLFAFLDHFFVLLTLSKHRKCRNIRKILCDCGGFCICFGHGRCSLKILLHTVKSNQRLQTFLVVHNGYPNSSWNKPRSNTSANMIMIQPGCY